MLGLKVITNIAQIVIQVVWNKEKLFVIKKVSQFGDRVYKEFTKHHDNLFNNKHVKRPKYKIKKAFVGNFPGSTVSTNGRVVENTALVAYNKS